MTSPTLAEALLQVAPNSNAEPAARNAAWDVINTALHQRWFDVHPSKFGASPDLVDDVRQTVLVKLLSGNATFMGSTDGEAVNFLKATARNATVDTLRRRRFEESLTEEQAEQVGGGTLPDERLRADDVSRRLREVVDRATKLARSPKRAALERHLSETLFGQSPADASLDADPSEAARLRKERSRALGLLRRAHSDLLAEVARDVNEEVDRIVRAILASPRASTEESG